MSNPAGCAERGGVISQCPQTQTQSFTRQLVCALVPSRFGSFACDGCIEDPVGGHRFLRDLYESQNDGTGR